MKINTYSLGGAGQINATLRHEAKTNQGPVCIVWRKGKSWFRTSSLN